MPGVFRPYTLTDVLAGMADQAGGQSVDTAVSGVGFFAESDESPTAPSLIARDQTSNIFQGTASSGTITWGTNPAAGAKVLVAIAVATNIAPTTVIDNGSSPTTFTLDASQAGTSNGVFIYRADGITLPPAGSYQVTATWSAAHLMTVMGQSYTGAAAGGPGAATVVNNSTSTSVSTHAVTPLQGGSLFFGAFQDNSALNPETISAPGGGFNAVLTATNGSSGRPGACADLIEGVTSATAQTCTWTLGDSVAWNAAMVAYPPFAETAPSDSVTATPQVPAGWDGAEWGQFSMEAELYLLATTGLSGFALQNGTPTIISWTAPSDGQMHRVMTVTVERSTSAQTGGAINLQATDPGGNAINTQLDAGGHGTGAEVLPSTKVVPVAPGTTVSIVQSSALTAGAGTVWAELWGA